MRRFAVGSSLLVLVGAAGEAAAVQIEGTVFADLDGDGLYTFRDEPLADVLVAWETDVFARTGDDGRYVLDAPGAGIVWARVPDGFSPRTPWIHVVPSAGAVWADLSLEPAHAGGPHVFVVASDTHFGTLDRARAAPVLARAAAQTPSPHFLVVTGDLTERGTPEEFALLADVMAEVPAPFVAVPGNHDWGDDGRAYRRALGPATYSFDAGGAHFLVLNSNAAPDAQVAFAERDLAERTAREGPVIAFAHIPPDDDLARRLEAAGIDVLMTGHHHANRTAAHGALVELNLQPLAMGGIDHTPAGYRVVSLVGDLLVDHHTVVDRPVVEITHPRPSACVPPGTLEVLAAVELGRAARVEVALDGAAPVALGPAGGWAYRTVLEVPDEGVHALRLEARPASGGEPGVRALEFCVARSSFPAPSIGEWPQLGGASSRGGAVGAGPRPPLRVVWAAAVGGHVLGGGPVVAAGRVLVPVVDLASGQEGGLVALDAATGAEVWAWRGRSVRGAPAFAAGRVVVATTDGVLRAFDPAGGAVAWEVDLGEVADDTASWLYASVAADGDRVFAATQGRLVAVDAASGGIVWSRDPGQVGWQVTHAAAVVSGGIGVAVVGLGADGAFAWDAGDGAPLWRSARDLALGANASPLVDGGSVYLINRAGEASALDLVTGDARWTRRARDGDRPGVVATPALAGGRLFLAMPDGGLLALDAATGERLWSAGPAGAGVLRPFPYGFAASGYAAGPIVVGDVVWAAGVDGVLRAVSASSGGARWQTDLGSPVLAPPVAAGELLVVATYDGTVRALAEGDFSYDPSGCDVRGRGTRASGALALGVLALVLGAGRVRRGGRRAPRS